MNVIIFGATGMVGQGVLRACLLDDRVTGVLAVGRNPLGMDHPKIREVIHHDFADFGAIGADLAGFDACFFCLGVTSAGVSKDDYFRITCTYTLAAARALAARSPGLTFVYVSGEGTDSTERGRSVWARVKGRTENELLAMDGIHAYMFRPGYIRPMHGATSRTPWYRWMYRGTSWLYPALRRLIPKHVTTTDALGRAMIAVAGRQGGGEHVLHSTEINRAAA